MQFCLYDPSQASDDFIDHVTAIGALPDSQRSFLSLLRETGNISGIRKEIIADFSERLKKINAPILMIWGREDRILLASEGEAAVERMAGARLHVMDQAGHLPHIDKPEEFNATVLDFLSD
jgi:pimeloyl-ACP methyl ester carboxylesterase